MEERPDGAVTEPVIEVVYLFFGEENRMGVEIARCLALQMLALPLVIEDNPRPADP